MFEGEALINLLDPKGLTKKAELLVELKRLKEKAAKAS